MRDSRMLVKVTDSPPSWRLAEGVTPVPAAAAAASARGSGILSHRASSSTNGSRGYGGLGGDTFAAVTHENHKQAPPAVPKMQTVASVNAAKKRLAASRPYKPPGAGVAAATAAATFAADVRTSSTEALSQQQQQQQQQQPIASVSAPTPDVVAHAHPAPIASAPAPTGAARDVAGTTASNVAQQPGLESPSYEQLLAAIKAFLDTKDASEISVKDVRRHLSNTVFPASNLALRKAEIKRAIYSIVDAE